MPELNEPKEAREAEGAEVSPIGAASPDALRIIRAFSSPEDAALMDEVMELVMNERQRRNAEPPREF